MRYLAVLIVLFGVVALPASKERQSVSTERYDGPQALVIYRKLMPLPINGKTLLLVSTTRTADTMCKSIGSGAEPVAGYAEALADFKRVNLQTHDLRSLLTAEHPQLISERDLQSLFHGNVEEGWKKFYRNNPNAAGYIAFSAIGFDKAGTLAAVYSEAVCGSLCGHGKLRFLGLGPNGWNEVTPPFPACDWIS